MTLRIAMWSGPRNISTAMMRAFENRDDTVVSDEPFYAAYLAMTGLDHPMRAEVLASQPNDWRDVAATMTGPVPGGRPLWYQKHMSHHMIDGIGLDWSDACRNAFLIRAPEQVLASYVRKRSEVTLDDIGIVRQAELFDRVAQRSGSAPPVIESADVLAAPRQTLAMLCAALGLAFSERMLGWPAGPRASDGVWAPAWYDVVERSTGFASLPATTEAELPDALKTIADAARSFYDGMARWRLVAGAVS
nr:HAD family hydrolase [Polymorphobacter sp.]